MYRKYTVELKDEERQHLEKLTSCGMISARMLTRAHILLKSDCGAQGLLWKYEQICDALNVTPVTVMRIRKSYVEGGLEQALSRKRPNRTYPHALDGECEAHLIALAYGEPPEGYESWSLRLLRDRFIQLCYVDLVSHETIRSVLKKTSSNHG